MRIVDRGTFLAMPAGTIYQKIGYQPGCGGCLDTAMSIKEQTLGDNDWVEQNLCLLMLAGCASGSDQDATMYRMEEDPTVSCPLDFECAGRDGFFETPEEVRFAVYERNDVEALVERLVHALEAGYPDPLTLDAALSEPSTGRRENQNPPGVDQ